MAKKNLLTEEDNAILAELGIEISGRKTGDNTTREERIIAGFEEIQQFVAVRGRLPEHGEEKDIFERMYAMRLDQILKSEECINLLKSFDHQGILRDNFQLPDISDDLDDEELLAQLGVSESEENSITELKHVQSRAEKKASEEIANRIRCEDFDVFKPLFESVKNEIDSNKRTTIRFRKDAGFTKTSIKKGQFIIIGGQISYIAEIGDSFKAPNGEGDARLRVIYANGTESNILLRSLIRAMYKDETSRYITDVTFTSLFSDEENDEDLDSGTIYVLRSNSNHPIVKENRNIVHKIGVTGGEIKKRFTSAKLDPTFLMAEVEVIATYRLANINRTKLEKMIHNFFGSAKLDIEIKDRFGKFVKATEWFLVPIFIIDQLVEKIKDGTVSQFYYDPISAQLKHY